MKNLMFLEVSSDFFEVMVVNMSCSLYNLFIFSVWIYRTNILRNQRIMCAYEKNIIKKAGYGGFGSL